MPVAHQPLAAVIGELVGMAADQGGNLRLDGLRQQRSRAVAQHLGQRIGECSWLGELANISLCHGVSLLRWRSGSFEHPHDTPPYPFMPSPTFVDSSEHGKPDDCFESRTIAEAELIIVSARAVRAQLLDTTSSELAPDTKADDGRHSEEGSRGGKVASAEERDLTLAYLRLLPTLSRIDKYERIAVRRRQRAVRKLCSAM